LASPGPFVSYSWTESIISLYISYISRDHNLAAMKVLIGDLTIADKNWGWDELGMLKVVRERDPQSWAALGLSSRMPVT
jgi:hypothetical protein